MFLKNSSSFRPEPTPSQQPKKRKLSSKTLPHNNPKARWHSSVQIPSLHSNAESKSSGQNIVKIQKLTFKIDFQINFKIDFKTTVFYLNS